MDSDEASTGFAMPESTVISHELLDEATLRYLRRHGSETCYPTGQLIIRRGEAGRSLFILLDGTAEVRIQGHDGRHLSLARLEPGATFGEVSILRNTPTTADVVAVSDVVVLEYPPEQLATALAECEPLRNKLLSRMAGNLSSTTLDTWKHFQRAETLISLTRADTANTPMVAVSARMRSVLERIEHLAQSEASVLITGEPGTGKLDAARRLHALSERGDEPMIVINCDQLPTQTTSSLLLGSLLDGTGGTELADELGSLHVAHQGTLLLRRLDALTHTDQLLLARQLRQHQRKPASFPDVRLVATVRCPAHGEPALESQLTALFAERVSVPSLAERPRDIVPLARELLRRAGHDSDASFELTDSAASALVSSRYRHRNVAELGDVIDLAVRCADSPQIDADHIVAGISEDDGPKGLDLARFHAVRTLIQRHRISTVRGLTLFGFAAAIVLFLARPSSSAAAAANAFVWNVWEPVVFASFLLVGAVWCTICPLSTAGRLAQKGLSVSRAHPHWLGTAAAALSLVGFFLILAVEQIFHMTSAPFPSGLLLLTLLLAAVVLSVVYRRELWCRHLCPLGRLASVLAPGAPLYLGARRQICSSSCTTHDCFKGTPTIPGCTVFHHPQQVAEAHQCKLCLDCLHSCPHGSAKPMLRFPLSGLLHLPSSASPMIGFAAGLFLLSPLLLDAQNGGWSDNSTALLTTGAALIVLAVVAAPRLLSLLSEPPSRTAATRVAFVLALIGWGPLMAYQLANVSLINHIMLQAKPTTITAALLPPGLSLATVLRPVVVLATAVVAVVALGTIRRAAADDGTHPRPLAWIVLFLITCSHIGLSLVLAFHQGP